MPKILRRNVPRQLYEYLLEWIHQRQVSAAELTLLIHWLDSEPKVPTGKWFKRFQRMIVCGEREPIKTFLTSDQTATGEEIR